MDIPNLTTPESQTHKPELDLDLVPPVPASNKRKHTRLYFFGIRMGYSIESVDLSFNHSRPRSVYGTIYLNTTQSFKVHTLYNRPTSDEAQPMSEATGGPVGLCGPKYFVDAYAPRALYLHLHEVGKEEPFFKQRVPLTYDVVTTGPTQTISVDAPGGDATLTIRMTVVTPSTLANVSLELSPPHSGNEWLVSGSVTAIQHIRGGEVERRVTLFNRPDCDPMRATDRIRLDRDVLLAPLLFDKKYIRKMDESDLKHGYPSAGIDPDNDRGNGVGCYLSCQVDLRLVDETGTPFLVRGMCHYQFKCSHASGALFRTTLKPISGEDDVQVSLILEPFLDTMCRMDGEPYENQMELCIKPPQPTYTDTHSEDEETDSEETDNEDEESLKPSTSQAKSNNEESNKLISNHMESDTDSDLESSTGTDSESDSTDSEDE